MNKQDVPQPIKDMGYGYFREWVHFFDNVEAGVNHGLKEIRDSASNSRPTIQEGIAEARNRNSDGSHSIDGREPDRKK
jgi:hypothetical protein